MTIYLFIDPPFNGNGCYPTSLRDEKKKEEKNTRGRWQSSPAIRWATNFLFLLLAFLNLDSVPQCE